MIMTDEENLLKLLLYIKEKSENAYRHIVGLIKVMARTV